MCFTFLQNALKLSARENFKLSVALCKCQPRKSSPSVVAVSLFHLLSPRSAGIDWIRLVFLQRRLVVEVLSVVHSG